jgi:hypothetical protein
VIQNEVEVAVQGEAAGELEVVVVCEGIALEADQIPTDEQRILVPRTPDFD